MKARLFYVVLMCLTFLSACKNSSVSVVSPNQVDEVTISIKNNQGQLQQCIGQDPKFLKALLGNINLLFNESDKNALPFGLELSDKQREFDYKIKFYSQSEVVQEIIISQKNEVTIDTDMMIIEDKEKELDSLKSQLILVTQ